MQVARPRRSPWGRIAGALAAWAALVAFGALELQPALRDRPRWWTVLLVLAPAVYVAAELLAAEVRSREAGVRISSATFSWRRVLVVLLVCLGVAALAGVALRL